MTSYTQLYLHCVWATWDRLPLIVADIETQLYAIMAATCRELGCTPLAIGGIDNYVHMLVRFSPNIAVAQLVRQIKGASSHAVAHAIQPDRFFKWQGSYGAFTISQGSVSQVCGYIQHQKIHHAEKTLINALERCANPDDTSTM